MGASDGLIMQDSVVIKHEVRVCVCARAFVTEEESRDEKTRL